MSINRFYTRVVPVVFLVIILVAATFAFAAANTVTTSYAGDGTGTISGYTVTVSYNLNATNPANADSASLTLSQPANAVHARVNAAGSWITCTGATTTWTCTFPASTTVSSLTSLQVVAAQ